MIFGGLVVVLIIVGVLLLVLPILRQPTSSDSLDRDQQNISIAREKKSVLVEQLASDEMTQEEYEAALADLEASLALDLERQQTLESNSQGGQWAVWAIAIAVPVVSIIMYLQLGSIEVIENPDLAKPREAIAQSPHGQGNNPTIEEMIAQLKAHLVENPDDARGWFMMGRTMMAQQQFDQAVTAFQRSYDLSKDAPDPSIMLALADSLAMTRNRDMTGEPEELVLEALKLSPNDVTALWLAGLSAEQGGRYREAYDHWTKLIPLLSADPGSTAEVQTLIERLRAQHPDLPEATQQLAVASTGLNVAVTLDAQMMSQVAADDLVFIYAKAASGPPMPLAAKRLKVSDLPIQVTLSDNDAMMPQMKMSSFDQIIVGARVSKTGNPIAQAGDLFNESATIQHKGYADTVQININQVKK